MHFRHERRAGQPRRERRTERDRVAKEFRQRLAARLQVVRPADGADAGRPVGERDEPEPAVVEPEDRDVALGLAGQPRRAFEVAEQRRAVVLRVLALAAQLVGEQRVAAGGVDDEARPPRSPGAAFVLGVDARAVAIEAHLPHPAALDRLRAARRGVAKQQLVELGAAHLPGVGHGLVPGVDELDAGLVLVLRRHELDAVLRHADAFDLLAHAERIEQRRVRGQKRFADVKARMTTLLEQDDVAAPFGEQGGNRRAGRAAADDENVAIEGRRRGLRSLCDERGSVGAALHGVPQRWHRGRIGPLHPARERGIGFYRRGGPAPAPAQGASAPSAAARDHSPR